MSDNNSSGREAGDGGKAGAVQRPHFAERLSAGLLAAAFTALGWLTLWQGGMALKGNSGLVTFVDGRPGRVVAALCFCAAAIGLLMFLRSFRPGRIVNLLALLALMVPPLLYVVARH